MRTVAGAEPPAVITCFADGYAAQVGADTYHDEPFGFLDALAVGLGVAEGFDSKVVLVHMRRRKGMERVEDCGEWDGG